MRGKARLICAMCKGSRITPAHAGKSPAAAGKARRFGDHPRTCGEKATWRITVPLSSGSPPHMRGKVASNLIIADELGITPAHAGKSIQGFIALELFEDHPRTCGEKPETLTKLEERRGSPPHMRGKAICKG